ncbi:MAG: glycosyltransferase [Clostridium sp.]|uniref:glycosyltransferase family protein n=1 Tax=Clostridium sp. TaxID=1506 RepID=UPI00399A0D4B
MNILFVYSNKTCGCTKKYTFELARGMKKYVNTKVIYYTELTSDIVKEFDVIILQRLGTITIIDKDEVNNIIDIIEKNKNIKKFIYIMDDLVLESQNGLPIKFISHCTDVLCTSKTLAKYIRKYNDNVHVFHTFIDVESFDNIPENKREKFTLVWASTGALGSNIIEGIVESKEAFKFDFDLIVIGGMYGQFRNEKWIKSYPILREDEMIKLIKSADILLNPLTLSEKNIEAIKYRCKEPLNDFLNSKSEVKYTIAGICKACILSSKTESFYKVIKNGINGFLLDDKIDEWINCIQYLYYHKDELYKITQNAYKEVKSEYSIDNGARQVIDVINDIVNQ